MKYRSLRGVMDERVRRPWAASESVDWAWGGVSAVDSATGLAWNTTEVGIRELEARRAHPKAVVTPRIRGLGEGREPLIETDPKLLQALEKQVNPAIGGHPQSPLRWTCKRTAKLAEELQAQDHAVSDRTVAALLKTAGYRLQANRKTMEGALHRDRNAQFEYISQQVESSPRQSDPVISAETKRSELVGEYKHSGQEWEPSGQPKEVTVHDFPDPKVRKAIS